MAAALPHRRLRLQHRHRRHDRRALFDPRQHLPCLRRRPVGPRSARAPSCTGASASRPWRRSSSRCHRPPTWCAASRATSPLTSSSASARFIVAAFVLGFFMSLGKAAVFKHIATYYPNNVGAVGGLVGMIGGLGGFVLPIAFGALNDLTGLWSSCFMLLFVIVVTALVWMDVSVRRMQRGDRAPVQSHAPPIRHLRSRVTGSDTGHDRETRHHRQRHGTGTHARAPARQGARPLRGHHLQRRAARQLRPHHAVAGALRRKGLRADHHSRRRLVHQERHHALQGAQGHARSTAPRRPSPPIMASSRPTTSWSSPRARCR